MRPSETPHVPDPSAQAPSAGELTELLRRASSGDSTAENHLSRIAYDELLRLARAQRRKWSGDFTMQTTALVHEAWMRLFGADSPPQWKDRAHFFAVASRAMRQILLSYARARSAQKRGGAAVDLDVESWNPVAPEAADQLVALHDALDALTELQPRMARVVELRFYTGLSVEDAAEVLGISAATVKREWRTARAWLKKEILGTYDLTTPGDPSRTESVL
jgi:RNA polymerase sigma factor (TIGR02999 family)